MDTTKEPEKSAPSDSVQSYRTWRSILLRLAVIGALIFVGLVAVLTLLQDRLIFPGTETQNRPDAKIRARPGTELIRLSTTRGEPIVALFGPALLPDGNLDPDSMSRPVLLYFYGNAMCVAYSEPELERFRRLGLNVLIPDYLGYGMSGGGASEEGCRRTAEAAYQRLLSRGFSADQIIAGGWSLGGAVAIDLAFHHRVGGLMVFSAFTCIQDMALSILPVRLPGFLFKHKFESIRKLPAMTCPILLGHGQLDTLVPFAMHGKLASTIQAPLSAFVVEGAGHNDFYDVGDRQIDQEVAQFLQKIKFSRKSP